VSVKKAQEGAIVNNAVRGLKGRWEGVVNERRIAMAGKPMGCQKRFGKTVKTDQAA
jgi:hypothetical protein